MEGRTASPARERRIAAIIPTWRKPADALEAVESLRTGTLAPSLIILLDNGSGDGSIDRLRGGTAGSAEVEVVGLPENLGFARAVNRGIERAVAGGATHLLLMNDDAVVDRTCIERLADALDGDDSLGMAAPRILYHGDPARVWQGEGRYSRLRAGVVSTEKNRLVAECAPGSRRVTFATGCVLLIRRSLIDDVGPLDERFYFYGEDVEFGRRAQRAGRGIIYVPEAVARHKIENVARDRTSPFVLYHLARSHVLRLRLEGGLELLWGLVVHAVAYTPFRMWQVLRGGGGIRSATAWFRGTLAGLTGKLGHA